VRAPVVGVGPCLDVEVVKGLSPSTTLESPAQ
jgi:hypothetical protein